MNRRCGLIAGNGRFPFLLLDAARELGVEMVVMAIKEETFPEIEQYAGTVHWLSLGQLGKLIKTLHAEGLTQAVMAGQVKHKQIFSSIVPDLQMMKLLAGLLRRNTDSLIGAVADLLAQEGITLLDSTNFLKPLLAVAGPMTSRKPNEEEAADIAYGLSVARELARLDIGQTIVVKDRAVVAVEAMEGTDATIRRAGEVCRKSGLAVVKVSKPKQDMRFDVPVVGPETIRTMQVAGATALSVDAGRTLLVDKTVVLASANRDGITIVGQEVLGMIRAAVVGVGSLGEHHARIYSEIPGVHLVGVCDIDETKGRRVAEAFGTAYFAGAEELVGKIDVVSVAVPTVSHAQISRLFLERNIHVLVEKPIASTLDEGRAMMESARSAGRVLQVGHLERFNPAVMALRPLVTRPQFFEGHRLSVFVPRSLDIDVVLDLMIHDLDLVLNFTRSEIVDIHALGIPVLTPKIDIANARIEFADGCVANLTASRVSDEKVRKLRFFQPSDYVSIDFLKRETEVVSLRDTPAGFGKQILRRKLDVTATEPLRAEIQSFLDVVAAGTEPVCSAEDGLRALDAALRVLTAMQKKRGEKQDNH